MIRARAANQPIMMFIASVSVVIALFFAQSLNLSITDFIIIVGALSDVLSADS